MTSEDAVVPGPGGDGREPVDGEGQDCAEHGYLKLPLVFRLTAAGDYAAARAAAAEAAEIGAGDSVAVTAGETARGAPLGAGVVTGVAAAVDSLSRAVAVRTRVRNPERSLRIGESLFGRIVTAIEPHAITVPVAALVPAAGGEGFQVFVVDSGDVVHVRPVTVGGRSEAVAEIVAGLAAGEVVVTNGAYGIADGARIARAPTTSR